MRQEIKERWVTALRSDEYKQGHGSLTRVVTDEGGMQVERDCCLGVLCKIAVADGVIMRYVDDSGRFRYGTSHDDSTMYLPDAVMRWAGLSENDPYVATADGRRELPAGHGRVTLSVLNDGFAWGGVSTSIERHDYGQIADVIESQL